MDDLIVGEEYSLNALIELKFKIDDSYYRSFGKKCIGERFKVFKFQSHPSWVLSFMLIQVHPGRASLYRLIYKYTG